jgi:hypothetical protein
LHSVFYLLSCIKDWPRRWHSKDSTGVEAASKIVLQDCIWWLPDMFQETAQILQRSVAAERIF